jgi:hypothetical protein
MNRHEILRILIITTGTLINFNQTAVTMYGLTDEELEELDTQEDLEEKNQEASQQLLLKTLEQANAKHAEIYETFKKLGLTRCEHSKQILKMHTSLKHLLYFYYFTPGFKKAKTGICDLLINNLLSLMATSLSQPCINRFGTVFNNTCLVEFSNIQNRYAKCKKKGFKLNNSQKCISQTRTALLSIYQTLASTTSGDKVTIEKILNNIEDLLNCSPFKITTEIIKWHNN